MSIIPGNRTLAATCCAALALLLASALGPAQAGGRHGGHGSHYSGKHHAGHGAHRHHGHRHFGHRHSGRWRGGVSIGIDVGPGGYGHGYGWPWWTPGYGVVLPPPVVYAYPPRAEPPPEPLAKGPPDPIFYPRRGQSAAQTEADLHECNRWALGQPNAIARADVFHRATLACMEGRDYTVR